MPNKKSSGHDHLDNELLKQIKSEVSESLMILINRSLDEGIFPQKMKLSDVFPLYKNKSRIESTNYRPISLLLTISKVLEKIVYKRVYSFLDQTSQIFVSQYGFCSKHSSENAIQELLGNVLKGQENGKHTLTVFLDLSKAFDTISHFVLFEKLERYGI